ncbi:hypothetical protein FHT12_000419 [Xanthomonas campestris]|nr:hypothetical protein [Xanthomonas euroxanthea]NIJ91761.1 hypothetical protein [Xanthomonas euroxanthea]SYZ54027.1 hypothetical protein CPBF367_21110 [Xanthomonas arboricola pv. juglandis]
MVGCRALLLVCMLGVAPGALSAAPDEAPASSRAYIETSYLAAPRSVGPFTLARSSYNPAAKVSGAAFHYTMAEHPELNIDVFVYPAGQRDQAEAIEYGMVAFRKDLAAARAQGSYSRLDELDQSRFVLTSDDAPKNIPANAVDAKVIAAIADAERIVGEKLRLSVDLASSGMPLLSNGYLFYKQLYYIKVRVSAAQQATAQTTFDALADQAARALVPAIQVSNIGGCADQTIYLDAKAAPEQGAVEMARQLKTHMGFNCHSSTKQAGIEELVETVEVIKITYNAGEWKSQ